MTLTAELKKKITTEMENKYLKFENKHHLGNGAIQYLQQIFILLIQGVVFNVCSSTRKHFI
jgi:hypothetical protein